MQATDTVSKFTSNPAFDPGAAGPALERWRAELDAETARVQSSSFVRLVRPIADLAAPDSLSPRQAELWVQNKPSIGMVGRADASEFEVNLGQGTGYLVDKDLVATAFHVVAPEPDAVSEFWVHLNGSRYPASLVAWNPSRDAAVLRLTSRRLPDAQPFMLSLDTLPHGTPILGMGYPAGSYSASPGVVQYFDYSNPSAPTGGQMMITGNSAGRIPEYVFRAPGSPGLSGSPFVTDANSVIATISRVPDLQDGVAYSVLSHSIDTANLLMELR